MATSWQCGNLIFSLQANQGVKTISMNKHALRSPDKRGFSKKLKNMDNYEVHKPAHVTCYCTYTTPYGMPNWRIDKLYYMTMLV